MWPLTAASDHTTENSQLPVPRDAFLAVLNHLALRVLVSNIDVAVFDRIVNALMVAADSELQAELFQIQLLVRRVLADVV